MPRTKRLHALKRPKLRQDWSKWTLYNLSRVTTPAAANKTFFQQKWLAKSMLRSYHNPDVREGTWTRMFDRRLPAVVPMDHRYLAQFDGSEMARGRGSGAEKPPAPERRGGRDRNAGTNRPDKTPYMHMTFHPLERRLDTAIFRALFASSVRQARQMVVHGFVQVNGKKMVYPGYALNPGDMFSVDPDRVLFSTGAQKARKTSPKSIQDSKNDKELKRGDGSKKDTQITGGEGDVKEEDTFVEYEASEESTTSDEKSTSKAALRKLLRRAKNIMDESKRELSGKRRQELRGFTQEVKKVFSQLRGTEKAEVETTIGNLESDLAEILTKIPTDLIPEAQTAAATPAEGEQSSNPQMRDASKSDAYRARKDAELLHAALERARANPIDVSKPYATPWRPRDFMSAFAFIPRYLEVNQNICSAVYLRHPVARPGLAEVPTPFSAETMGLGFNWYLRRR